MKEQHESQPRLTEAESQALADAAIDAEFKAQEAARRKRAQNLQIIATADDAHLLVGAELRRCEQSFFYWVENYVWIEDPFNSKPKIPMLLYPYQKDAATLLIDLAAQTESSTKKFDVLVEKTREMGWSWLIVVLAVWYWCFKGKSNLFGSRTMETADKPGDMKSLLEKCRYIIRELPDWMLPIHFSSKEDLTEKLLRHGKNGAAITADAASTNFGRADRKVFTCMDEFAHWPFDDASSTACSLTTKVRLFVSTPNGPFGRFAKLAGHSMLDPSDPDYLPPCEIKIRSHWLDHPVKAAGATLDNHGNWTSPWYRQACKGATADEIAREIDIGYERSMKGLIFPDYNRDFNSGIHLIITPSKEIVRIWDPGVACFFVLWLQIDKHGRVVVLQEYKESDAQIRNVARAVISLSNVRFPDSHFIDVGDPAGQRINNSGQEHPEFQVLRDEFNIHVDTNFLHNQPTQLWQEYKHGAIHNKINESFGALGTHGLLIDREKCPSLDRALIEGYRWKVDPQTRQVREGQVNGVHPYEDAVDCLAYGILSQMGLGTINKSTGNITKVQENVVQWNKYRQKRQMNR